MPQDSGPRKELPELRSRNERRKMPSGGSAFSRFEAPRDYGGCRGDATIMALAGHVSRKMLEHYSHVRQEAKREAVNMLSAKRPKKPTIEVYDTNYDTNSALGGQIPAYLIEKMVGTTGFEPATSPTPRVRSTRLSHVPTVR